jgi:hypothetical protein
MNLIMKVLVLVVAIIVVAGVVLYAFGSGGGGNNQALTQAKAEQLVLSDVNATNPGALVTIENVSPSALASNSWNIVLSVVYNATTPCPTLLIEGFDYPATGLSPSTYNQYTNKCVIYGLSTAPSYVIGSQYIAIARSYNNTVAYNYVNTYGYKTAVVHAKFYSTLYANQTPIGNQFTSVWLVNYSAVPATYNQYLILSLSGSLLGNYTSTK